MYQVYRVDIISSLLYDLDITNKGVERATIESRNV